MQWNFSFLVVDNCTLFDKFMRTLVIIYNVKILLHNVSYVGMGSCHSGVNFWGQEVLYDDRK